MLQDNNRNLILAMGLSILVIIGWNYFFATPQYQKEHSAQIAMHHGGQNAEHAPGSMNALPPRSPNAPPQSGPTSQSPRATMTREAAIAATPRVPLDSQALFGSINLVGARIDDVSFKDYRETTNPKSPNIVLLSPSGAPTPYYTEVGYVGGPGNTIALPTASTLWKSNGGKLTSQTPIELTYDNGHGLVFHRRIAVDDHYMFTVTDTIDNTSGAPVTIYPYSLVARHGKGEASTSSFVHEGFVGVIAGTEEKETYDKIAKEANAEKDFAGTGGWLGLTAKYWAAVVVPDQNLPFKARFLASGDSDKIYQADFRDDNGVTIAPGKTSQVTSRVFAGAKETQTLDQYQSDLGIQKFDLLIDWGWLYFITKPMFRLLDLIYKFTGNFGIAILIVTALIKAVFFPLANRSYLSMAKMKGVQPQMNAIRERYADDKIKQQQELMELYKREKINPVSGCLPMLIQVPVFWAYYTVLSITIEMRQAPFFGWIKDLSQPDPTNIFTLFGLVHWHPTVLPLVGHFLDIGIWPLVMGLSMFIQMKMNPEPTDPVQKQMFTWMPVIFTFMLGSFPSGLVIYWTWNNLLSVTQQTFIMHRAGVKVELWGNLANLFRKKAATST